MPACRPVGLPRVTDPPHCALLQIPLEAGGGDAARTPSVAPASLPAPPVENCRTAATQAVAPLEDTARSSSTQIFNVLNAVIRQQHFNTAVSILAMPDLNERANVDDNPSATKDYMSGLRTLTGGIGPVMLTKAQADSSVITTDL